MIGSIIQSIIHPIIRPIMGFGILENCLIKNGILKDATFFRTGDVVALVGGSPVTFGPNETVTIAGGMLHHGQITEYAPYVNEDYSLVDWRSANTAVDGNKATVEVVSSHIRKDITTSEPVYIDVTLGQEFFGSRWACIQIVTQFVFVDLLLGEAGSQTGAISEVSIHSDTIDGAPVWRIGFRYANIDVQYVALRQNRTDTGDYTVQDCVVGDYQHIYDIQCSGLAYSKRPLHIYTDTEPVTIDTCESAPNPDEHGVNWKYSNPKLAWFWDLMDGVADGAELVINGGFDTDLSSWENISTYWSWVTGRAYHASGTEFRMLLQNIGLLDNGYYEVTVSVEHISGGDYRIQTRDATGALSGAQYLYRGSETKDHVIRFTNLPDSRQISFSRDDVGVASEFYVDNVSVKQIFPASGILNLSKLNIRPSKTEWNTIGDFNILSGADGSQIIYLEEGTGLLCVTDGTNTCKSNSEYVARTDMEAVLLFSKDGRMRIDVGNIAGQSTDFVGYFPLGVTGKWGLGCGDMFSIGGICGSIGLDTLPPMYITIQGDQLTVQGSPVRILE